CSRSRRKEDPRGDANLLKDSRRAATFLRGLRWARAEAYSLPGGSAVLLGAQLIGNAGLFVGVLIIARALGPEGRGTIAFLLVTAQVVAILAGVGLPQATMVQIAEPAHRAP